MSEAHYTPPRQTKIAGIPALIVDPHNEVYPFWHEHLKLTNPLTRPMRILCGRRGSPF